MVLGLGVGIGLTVTGGSEATTVPTVPCPPAPPTEQPQPPCHGGGLLSGNALLAGPAGGTDMTKAQAEAMLGATATTTSAVHAKLTTYAAAFKLEGAVPDPTVNPRIRVWVVTTTAAVGQQYIPSVPAPIEGQPTPAPITVETTIMNAVTGSVIDTCIGCNAVTTG